MNGLSLCSGIGGIDLGLHLAVPNYRTICYVEKEPYCQDILLARMADGVLGRAPIWDDVRRFDATPWRGLLDVVHGGYPCQPFSVAGKRAGSDDPRHLWPDIARIVRECEPEWCFFENVPGHLSLGYRDVRRELVLAGYAVTEGLFTAAEVGAPHRRQRLYVLARRFQGHGVADPGCGGEHENESGGTRRPSGTAAAVLVRSGPTVAEVPAELPAWPPGPKERDRWAGVPAALKPAVCRVAHGLPHRVDRLKALGNAVVPDVAALAWRTLSAQL